MEHLQQKNSRRRTFTVLLVVLLLVAGALMGFMRYFNARNDELLYAERQNQMREVTTQLFSGLEDVVNHKWEDAKTQARALVKNRPSNREELIEAIAFMDDAADFASQKGFAFAVDSQGYFYNKDGRQGLIREQDYLLPGPERVSYVSNTMSGGTTRMNFLYRLDEPVEFTDGAETTTIIYAGISIELSEFSPYLDCEAYESNNAAYILDNTGYKLFNNDKANLLSGYNAFSVLREMQYLHGADFDDTLNTLEQDGTAFSNAILDGTEFYYALRRMENTEWTLLFLIPSEYVATNTVALMDSSTQTILLFAIVMLVITSVSIFMVMQAQQRRELATEVQNRQILEQTNDKLAQTNKELEKAQKATRDALQAAEAASKAKTDFLSNMSHDIRTPMNAIIGLTTLMENEPGLSDKMHDYIAKLESSGHHLLELINNVLDMNRIESGKTTLNVTNINLAEQITQVESIIGAQANQKNQTFTIVTSHLNHEHIIADPARLQQVLVNILSNSVKYTPKGGHILFEIEELPRDERYAKYKFIVQDDGIGMSEEFMQHIFDPFTRAENSTTNKVQGTGLGMAITKTVVELMGGVIHVDSTPGKGSRFEVTLVFPIDTEADQNVQHLSVLLVHCTNEERYQRVRDAAEGKPVHLHRTRTQAEACVTLRQANFDVVLMPLDTAESDVEQLRKLAAPDTILLGAARSQNVTAIAANGLDGVLPYPFFLSNLESEVHRVQQARKENEPEDVSPLSGMKFLCAEDNEINAEILQMLLETRGASCTIYHNGQEIVDAFASVRPGEYDMILMDVQMPVMDGLEATRLIRSGANPLGKSIPILAMTANAFLEDRQKSKEAGMDEHLSKPVDITALEQTVRRFRLTPPERIINGGARFAR